MMTFVGPQYLFAYGTLITGSGNRRSDRVLAACCIRVGPAFTYGELFDMGDYPGMPCTRRALSKAYGMVYRLLRPARALAALDSYEGYRATRPGASEFLRRRTVVYLLPAARAVSGWVYVYNRPVRFRPRVRRGDYLAHRRQAMLTR
jgi:gamma-glutamylcyclotransferase (GGCT)/AIG2-like uncharacterized protein YtfP